MKTQEWYLVNFGLYETKTQEMETNSRYFEDKQAALDFFYTLANEGYYDWAHVYSNLEMEIIL
ncbi:putative phage protein [Streptococcus phage C1]|uniref:Putative phage protein n=1 Tax=Streptococcus phage C1 TaxID=2907838 RepID=Q7Y3G0_BPSC1|nr:hypothetical protein C1p02 [Streptococcus phage C1]AAP42301.1 putative phage protein [Streptococcus phage C1]